MRSPSSALIRPPFDLVVVGASAGGVGALSTLLEHLPPNFPAAIAIVQHMRPGSTYFVEILQRVSGLAVQWAEPGISIEPGTVTVAVPDRHLVIGQDRRYAFSDGPRLHFARPAIDLLFESAAAVFADRTVGVVLSGYGRDGAVGSLAIKNGGGRILVQDRSTSHSFQMPQAVIDAGTVDFVLPIRQLAIALTALMIPGISEFCQVSGAFSYRFIVQSRLSALGVITTPALSPASR